MQLDLGHLSIRRRARQNLLEPASGRRVCPDDPKNGRRHSRVDARLGNERERESVVGPSSENRKDVDSVLVREGLEQIGPSVDEEADLWAKGHARWAGKDRLVERSSGERGGSTHISRRLGKDPPDKVFGVRVSGRVGGEQDLC